MKIQWINHAGFLIESGSVRLVCDPWIEGTAFDNGWKLLSPTAFQYADFERVTHIWFSHEHPDHFSPMNIKKIAPEVRSQISVLYQTTDDKKVVEFCKKAGFKAVVELPPSKWYRVAPDFEVMNQNDKDGDSWLAIHTDGKKMFNMNDVVAYRTDSTLQRLGQLVGKIDVLFTQFSYASWVGNKTDLAMRQQCAQEKIADIEQQIRILQPQYVVPFASFVWFCHEENFYVNEGYNKVGDIHNMLSEKNVTSIVMYPNDVWTIGEAFDSEKAVKRYEADYERIAHHETLVQSQAVPMPELQTAAEKFVTQLRQKNGAILSFKLKQPAKIFFTDLQQTAQLTLQKGLETLDIPLDDCDIAVSSAALAYCFKFDWGGGTLNVNARFEKPRNGNFSNLENYFYIANLNNMGKRYTAWKIVENVARRMKEKLIG
jgi:UDP-MurNAc hydroxylase